MTFPFANADIVRLANVNDGDICSIFGMKRGGLAGGGCGRQMRQALEEAPNVGDAAEGQKDGIYTDSSKRLIIEIKDEVVIKSRSYN